MKKITKVIIFTICIAMFSVVLFAESKVRIGVILNELSKNDIENFKMKENYGIIIEKVTEESPAEKAGLLKDDIILEVDGDKIYTIGQLKKMLTNFKPKQKVKLKYFRNGKTKNITIELEEKKKPTRAYLGVFLEELNEKIIEKLNISDPFGILISKVVEDSPAEDAGLKDEDVLLKLDSEKVFTVDQLIKMLKNYKPEQKIKLEILRDNMKKNIKLVLGEKEETLDYFFNKGSDFMENFQIPENVLFYKYDQHFCDKWIGVQLEIKKNKTNNNGKESVTKQTIISKVIKGAPAEEAGLKSGDEIIEVEGDKDLEISEAIKGKEIGDKISLTLLRDDKKITKNVIIGKRQEELFEDSKIEVTIDDGEVKIIIDGEEKTIADIENLGEKMENIKMIKKINMNKFDDMKDDIENAAKKIKKIEIFKNLDEEI